MNPQYPCKRRKNVDKDKDTLICCNICNLWSHVECANVSPKTYEKLQNDVSNWNCSICVKTLPFSDLRTKN